MNNELWSLLWPDHDDNPLLTCTAADMWRWCPDVDDSKQRLNAQWAYVLENVPSLGKIVQDLSSLVDM